MKRAVGVLAALLCAGHLGAQGYVGGGSVTSPVATDPLSFTGVVTFNNAANTPLTCSDGIKTGPAATTGDATADSLMVASATTQAALLIETKPTPTKSPFIVQQSDGTDFFSVGPDGNVVIDQRTGGIAYPLQVKYQGNVKFHADYLGVAQASGGLESLGYITATTNITGRHLIGSGTSPTAPAGGGTCGTSAPTIAGKDSGFQLTVGSVAATSCTVTFGTAWTTNAPTCVANGTATAGLKIATTVNNVTISAAALAPAEVLHVACIGF